MNRESELQLIQRCLQQHDASTTTLVESIADAPVDRYLCADRFARELAAIHRRMPVPWVHVSELAQSNNFRRVNTSLGDVLFTRDDQGTAHAFHNVCRHRGSTLVDAGSGNAQRFVCPYHAWSYAPDGKLLSIPFEQECFPDVDKATRSLASLPCVEKHGFLWLCPGAENEADAHARLTEHLATMSEDLQWLELGSLQVFRRSRKVWQANWKLLSEGGLETYHFRTAHRNTIGPYFLNNLAVQDRLGIHSRVVMPSKKIDKQSALPPEEQRLRDFTHTLFGVAPQTSFLLQEGHIDWIRMTPIAVDATEIEVVSLVPVEAAQAEGSGADTLGESARKHWNTNFEITMTTLDEDFEIAEGIQRNLASGANRTLLFGRNEGLLAAFNAWVDAALL